MIILAYILIGLFAGLNMAVHIGVCLGIIRARMKENRRDGSPSPGDIRVSVVIPAKNEENNLPSLFRSLSDQTVAPAEIIFIDDRSEDSTPRLFEQFRRDFPGTVKIISINEGTNPVNPKQHALTRGIAEASGDILMFTDADCQVAETWIEGMVRQFSDPSVGLCFAPIHTKNGEGFLHRYQVFDHVFRYFYTVGSAGIGMPTGGFGNNLAVRRNVLEEIGGYDSIEYSVTEDAALISAVRTRSPFTVEACTHGRLKVLAEPQQEWRTLSRQEQRWSAGAFFSKDLETLFGYALVMIFLFGAVVSLPLGFLFTPFFFITGSIFLGMTMVAVSAGICLRMKWAEYWLYIIPSILWSGIFYTYNNILSLSKAPLIWKGKKIEKG